MDEQPGSTAWWSTERPPPSARTRRLLLAVAILTPMALPAAGAYVADLAGWRPSLGAFAGAIATAVLIGLAWIVLGAYAGWQLWRDARGSNEESSE